LAAFQVQSPEIKLQSHRSKQQKQNVVRCQWLTPVILDTQEAEIRRSAVRSQPRQIVRETLSLKNHHKKRAGGVTQGVGPKFKPQYRKKKKKEKKKRKMSRPKTSRRKWKVES
jgi:hypothetical protein